MLPLLPSHRHVGWKVNNVDAWMRWLLHLEHRDDIDDDDDVVASFSLYYYEMATLPLPPSLEEENYPAS